MRIDGPVTVLCFSDVLCGYCYLGDEGLARLQRDFGREVQLSHHFVSTHGDVRARIARSGESEAAYGRMVYEGLRCFDHAQVHPGVFSQSRPTSSTPAHLYLRAVKLLEEDGVLDVAVASFERLMRALRRAFFRDLADISKREVLDEIAERLEIPSERIARVIDDGRAFAALAHDLELQRKHNVSVVPALVLDEGRQLLSGNVGYRVIEANVRELLSSERAPARCG